METVRHRELNWTKAEGGGGGPAYLSITLAGTRIHSSPTEEWDITALCFRGPREGELTNGGKAGDTSKNITIGGSMEKVERKQSSQSK